MERITRENIESIKAKMIDRHSSMMAWSKENQNELGGLFGMFQKAMGDPEILAEMSEAIQPLLVHDELFFSELPTCSHRGRELSMKRRKQRSLDEFLSDSKRKLEEGKSIYLHNILWQPPYEVMGIRNEGYVMTMTAEFNWKNDEKR